MCAPMAGAAAVDRTGKPAWPAPAAPDLAGAARSFGLTAESHMRGGGAEKMAWPRASRAVRVPLRAAATVSPRVRVANFSAARAGLAAAVAFAMRMTSL